MMISGAPYSYIYGLKYCLIAAADTVVMLVYL